MEPNFISLLFSLLKKYTDASGSEKNVNSLTKNSITNILNSYELDSFYFSQNKDFKFSFFLDDIVNYLLALSCSIHVANKYQEKL